MLDYLMCLTQKGNFMRFYSQVSVLVDKLFIPPNFCFVKDKLAFLRLLKQLKLLAIGEQIGDSSDK